MPDTDAEQWEIGDEPEVDPDAAIVATAPEKTDVRRARRELLFRRAFASVLTVFLLGGILQAYGVHSRTVTAQGGGLALDVRYAKVTRPGLATPFVITVRSLDGGFDGPVRIAVAGEYLDMFDENGLDPDPSTATADARAVLWEFEPPPGPVLTVTFDARIEPAVQWGRNGFVEALDGDRPVARVAFYTWVLP